MFRKKIVFIFVILIFMFPLMNAADVLMLGPADLIQGRPGDYICTGNWIYKIGPNDPYQAYFYAPIHLPEGAKITAVTFFYYDNNPDGIMTFILKRVVVYSGIENEIGSYTTTSAVDSIRYSKIKSIINWQYNKILNNVCTYFLKIYSEKTGGEWSDLKFYGAKIFYSVS